jgi:peptide/nickel transport system substrate-binding protein
MKVTKLSRRYFLGASVLTVAPILAACSGGAPASPTAAPAAPAAAAPTATSAPAAAAPTATTAPAAAAPTATTAAAAPTATTAAAAAATPTTAAAASTGAQADLLKLLWWQAPTILNPHLSQGTKDYDAAHLFYEPMAAFGYDGNPVAILATDVPTVANGGVSADLTTVTWKLKQGVKWHDGTDFTADDVAFTFQYMSDKATAATTSTAADGVKSVEAKDPHTVVVTYAAPNPDIYQFGVGQFSMIIQKAQFKDYMGDKAKDGPGNLKPIGTGPFKIVDFKPGDVVTGVANDQYHVPGKPGFKNVQLKGGGDATSAARAIFQTGDADYAWNLQVEATVLKQLMDGGKGDLLGAVGPNVERILLNRADPNKTVNGAKSEPSTQHPFLSDLKVRQAFAMACDRETIANQLYGAPLAGVATTNLVSAPDKYVSQNTAKMDVGKFDLAKAAALLDEAGWVKGSDGVRAKNGVRMHVVYQTTINPLRQKTQAIIKQAWESIGIETELKSVDAGVFFSSDAGNPDTAAHFYTDVEMYTNGSSEPDQTSYLDGWTSSQIVSAANKWQLNNTERYNSPEYDALFAQYQKETDPDKRAALVIQLNDKLVSDVVAIPLVARKLVGGKSKQLQGPAGNPGWDSDLWNVRDWTKSS